MQWKQWLAAASLAFVPFAVSSQPNRIDPVDAGIPVAAPRYESAFRDYRPLVEEESTPDTVWRSINDKVKELGGHAGHVKESAHVAAPAPPAAIQHGKHH